jgi:cytochrome c peroxidase
MFWDGRATGEILGDTLAEQAQGPFLNPLEQAVESSQALCAMVKQAGYAELFEDVWGANTLDCAKDTEEVYERIGRSIAAYERSAEVSPYSSKFDRFWDAAKAAGKNVREIRCGAGNRGGMMGGMMGGMGCPGGNDAGSWTGFRNLGLSDVELQGLATFNDPNRANCSSCHSLEPGSAGYPLFTDFGYDNLGIPKNPSNPFYTMAANWNPYGANWVDYGLGGYLKGAGYGPEVYEPQLGKFKTPTLRNVDLRPSPDFVKAYGHNGYFKSLEEIVLFYHQSAMMGGMGGMGMGGMHHMFPPPEVVQNRTQMNMFPMPHVYNIVEFLKTLSDGYYQR